MTDSPADGVNMFTCQGCGGTFEKGRPDEEARAEADQLWGSMGPGDEAVVCEDCWQAMMGGLEAEAARFGVLADIWRPLLEAGREDPLVQASIELIRSRHDWPVNVLAQGLVDHSRQYCDLMKRHVDLVANGPQPPMVVKSPWEVAKAVAREERASRAKVGLADLPVRLPTFGLDLHPDCVDCGHGKAVHYLTISTSGQSACAEDDCDCLSYEATR